MESKLPSQEDSEILKELYDKDSISKSNQASDVQDDPFEIFHQWFQMGRELIN